MSEWNLSYFETLSAPDEARLLDEAGRLLSQNVGFRDLVDMDHLMPRAREAIAQAASGLKLSIPPDALAALAEKAAGRVGGLGFLLPLFQRSDLSEVALNPDGTLWVLPKGERNFRREPLQAGSDEIWRAVEALLRPLGRALSEASPTVDGKLPRVDTLPGLRGGARIKVLHPAIAPGKAGFPSINIRLFEPVPVSPQQIVAWRMAPESVVRGLLELVGRGYRMLICGGTASGKTTLLSALAHGIPENARVVKIEDPEEIWLDHPDVVTIEARPAVVGSTVPGYTITDGVNDALRMAPRWLIVGEVRTGDAAMALFRAQMSDHPGLSTFHAESPQFAVERMVNIMWSDAGVYKEPAKVSFAQAVDLLVQIGWREEHRVIASVVEVSRQLKGGDVAFTTLYQYGDEQIAPPALQRSAT